MKKRMLLPLTATCLVALVAGGCGQNDTESKVGKFTYNTYLSTKPKTWNVHNWETSDESYIPAFTEMGLYDLKLNSTKDGYEIIPEMAAAMPVDVTDSITDDEMDKYGYTGNLDKGFVWEIALNEKAVWEDGTAINADTYVQSMERQLNPKMVNFRADSYYASSLVLANAERYYKQGRKTIEALYNHIKDDGNFDSTDVCQDGYFYLNLGRYTPYVASVFGGTDETTTFYTVLNQRSGRSSDAVELAAKRITDAASYFAWKYCDHEGDYADEWEEIDEGGYSKLSSVKEEMLNFDMNLDDFDNKEVYARKTENDSSFEGAELYDQEALKKDLKTVVAGLGRGGVTSKEWAWMYPLFGSVYNDYKEDFDNVGITKVSDYKLKLFLKQAVTDLDLKFSLSSNWIVDVDLYDSLKVTTAAGLVSTKYATPDGGVAGYKSYGPYKLVAFEAGKSFKIEKNDKWYGYTDGKHEGEYKMTGVYTRIITEHNTAMQEFEKGNLDDIELNRSDMKNYGNSSRLTSTYESYTQKISMNSDRAKLLSRQSSDGNKTILANKNFREGLSLAMDRNQFASQTTAGAKGFTGLLNDLYLTDVESGEMYRQTAQGKSVYNKVYGKLGGDPYASDYEVSALNEKANGYNFNMATKFVADAFQEEFASTAEGHLQDNQTIKLEFRVYDDESETTIDMLNFIQNSFSKVVAAANEKIGSNITIKIESQKDEDYYNTAKNGGYDLIFSTWGGAAINPVGLMQVYCDSTFESNCEYGFKGHQNEVYIEIDANGDGVISASENKTFNNWWTEINGITENDEKGSAAYNEKHQKILNVLAGLEAGVINRFEAIPLVARASASLNSFKIENGSPVYINLIGYGGIRHLQFNYDDAEWDEFVASHNNLSELYKN